MSWKLSSNDGNVKVYINEATGSECILDFIYSDISGANWYGFRDLFSIPKVRLAYARSIADLFNIGLSASDITGWISEEKKLLKSNDPEKYEKLYSLVLQKESLVNNTVDPMLQYLSVATVYVVGEDERIDYFNQSETANKLKLWSEDKDAQSFFLGWYSKRIITYMSDLKKLTQIASINQEQ